MRKFTGFYIFAQYFSKLHWFVEEVFTTFQDFSRPFKTFQDFSRLFKTFQDDGADNMPCNAFRD